MRNRVAHALDDVERVRRREGPHAHERRGFAVEADVLLVVLGAEHDVGDLAQPDHHAAFVLDHELPEFFGRAQVGVRDEVHGHHRAFRPSERRQVVVPAERVAQRRRRDAERSHPIRLEPDTHRERAGAENLRALHAVDRAQLRLDDACEIVRDLIRIEIGRREPDVDGRELRVGRLHLDDWRLGLRRQVVADLRDLRLHLRERGVGVVVELQVHGDRADALRARRFHVVDAVGARDDALERRRDETADEVGVGADVRRRDLDDRDVAARVLPDAQRANRLHARNQNHEADDDRQHRPLDEEIGETHQLFSGRGFGLLPGLTLLLTSTAAPLRSLKTPEVTTSSPGLMPDTIAT